MDWMNKLNEVLDYIDANLQSEISYEHIAETACCSVYNFQRMFSYVAQMPLAEYIRSRRLTMAAFDLMKGEARIVDIALMYGYESQDAFSRAFRSFHGVLPSVARSETVMLKSCPKLSFQLTIKGSEAMNYQVEQWPAFKAMGYSKRIKTEEAFRVVPIIWEQAWKDGTMQTFIDCYPDCRPAGFLGIAAGGQWGDSEEMDYILAVTKYVDAEGCLDAPIPEGMSEFSYPCRHLGHHQCGR